MLAFLSVWAVAGLAAHQPGGRVDALFEGPVFRAGAYLGALIFPNYTTRGTNAFYLVRLFGTAADFLGLMAFRIHCRLQKITATNGWSSWLNGRNRESRQSLRAWR